MLTGWELSSQVIYPRGINFVKLHQKLTQIITSMYALLEKNVTCEKLFIEGWINKNLQVIEVKLK